MKNKHVKKYLFDYLENKLSDQKKSDVKNHLEECSECKSEFNLMNDLLNSTNKSYFKEIEPDPYLEQKIRVLDSESENKKVEKSLFEKLKWSFAAAAFSVAVYLGILMGTGLSSTTTDYNESEIVSAYYSAFSQQSIFDRMEVLLQSEKGAQQ